MTDLIDRAALLSAGDATKMTVAFEDWNRLDWKTQRHILNFSKAFKRLVEYAPAVDAVEVVKSNEEIEKAISVLNVYRNTYYKEPSGTVKYAVADAISTILPLFAKCLERRTDA